MNRKGIEAKPLQYGLNIRKNNVKKGLKLSGFDHAEPSTTLDPTTATATKTNIKSGMSLRDPKALMDFSSSAAMSKSLEIQQKALEQDATIFDYDACYDELKKNEFIQKKIRDGDVDGGKKARYMADLIKSANDRKMYLERAKEKKLQKEREEEGWMETEEFITEAYLEKQREMARLEEEQRKLEEKEMDPNRKRDMTGFYRELLEKRSGPIVLGDKTMAVKLAIEEEMLHKEEEAKIIDSSIILNDNREVVDKRQLLTGGLNISSKALKRKQIQDEEEENRIKEEKRKKEEMLILERKKYQDLQNQQARNRAAVMAQKALADQKKKEAEEKKEKLVLEELTKSTVSANTVSDAKARYLARKAAEAAAAANTTTSSNQN